MTVTVGELQVLAKNILDARKVELGTGFQDHVEAAMALGYLTLDDETRRSAGLLQSQSYAV